MSEKVYCYQTDNDYCWEMCGGVFTPANEGGPAVCDRNVDSWTEWGDILMVVWEEDE